MRIFGWLGGRQRVTPPAAITPTPEDVMRVSLAKAKAQKHRKAKIEQLVSRLQFHYPCSGQISAGPVEYALAEIILEDKELCDTLVRMCRSGIKILTGNSYKENCFFSENNPALLEIHFDSGLPESSRAAIRRTIGLPENPVIPAGNSKNPTAELQNYCETELNAAKAKIQELLWRYKNQRENLLFSLEKLTDIGKQAAPLSMDLPGYNGIVARLENRIKHIDKSQPALEHKLDVLEKASIQFSVFIDYVACCQNAEKALAACDDLAGLQQTQNEIAATLQAAYALKNTCEAIANIAENMQDVADAYEELGGKSATRDSEDQISPHLTPTANSENTAPLTRNSDSRTVTLVN